MWQELGDHGQAGMSSPSDRFAQPGGVPVDDDGGKQVEACHAVVPAFRAAIPDFSLTADAQGVLQEAETFEVGRGVRAGAGENPVPAAGEEQCEAGARETGSGSGRASDRAAPAGGDESVAGAAGSDPGGPGRVGRPGAGTSGLAAGGGARAMGSARERWRGKELGELEKRSKREWSALYGRHQRQRDQLAKDCHGVLGRFRLWRELGGGVREIGGAIRGRTEVLGRFRAELEDRQRWERVSLGKTHSEAVRGIESKAGEFYRGGMEGSEKRAREAARSDGLLLDSYRRPDEFYRLKYSMLEERLEQVREIDGEQAYEKMRGAVEKASQEKARQVEKARQMERARQVERAGQVESRPERRGPERGGAERDFGPSR